MSNPYTEPVLEVNIKAEPPTEWKPSGHPIENLSDREIAMETLYWLRMTGQAMQEMQKVGPMGLIKAMMSGNGK